MASLPNLEPLRPSSSDPVVPGPPLPPRKPVSFSIDSGQGKRNEGESSPVVPFPLGNGSRAPHLPKSKRPIFSRHRHDANPALAIKVLQDIQMAVEEWHSELRQIVQNIQGLYMEGPIVDGWLETIEAPLPKTAATNDAAILRHGDPQALSGYVERLCESFEASEAPVAKPELPNPEAAPSYRLCNLNAEGQLQCMPCPAEQVSTLSLAIARHQKLRQLLDQKSYLEAKLKRAVEVLTGSRDSLGIAPTCSSAPEPPISDEAL